MLRSPRRNAGFAIVCALLIFYAFGNPSVAVDNERTKILLGTATKGGGFQLFGQNLVEVLNETDPSMEVEAVATRGSRQNLRDLETGVLDIGLVEGNAARQALDGIGRPPADLKVLSVMYPNPGMFVVRADSPYQRIDDLRGRPIAFGTRASGLRILAADVLDGIGLNPDRDFEQVILDRAADGPGLVLEREVDALWGAGIGWPGFVKISDAPEGARFITPSAAQIKQILVRHPHLKPMSVPAGTYKGQNRQIDSVGLWSLILVRPDLPEEVAYRLARAIHRGEGAMAKRLKQGRYTTVENTLAQVPAERLHTGAALYYREGWSQKLVTIADARAKSAEVIDTGTPGDSPGDILVFDQPLLDSRYRPLGNNSGTCIRIRIAHSFQCQWTLTFADGSVQVAGREFDQGTSRIAVVGGTGRYAGISGEMTSVNNDDGTFTQTLYYRIPSNASGAASVLSGTGRPQYPPAETVR